MVGSILIAIHRYAIFNVNSLRPYKMIFIQYGKPTTANAAKKVIITGQPTNIKLNA